MPLLNQKFFRDKKIEAIRESMNALAIAYTKAGSLVCDLSPNSFITRKEFSLNPENDGVSQEIFITEYSGDVFREFRKHDGIKSSNIASILRTNETLENIVNNVC